MPELPEDPLNREPNLQDLTANFITRKDGYDRNHGKHPEIDGSKHRVNVDGKVKTTLKLSISSLQNDFLQHTVVCALQCAGNRRHTMRTKIKEVQGIDWFEGAVMNCKWRGPLLRDVLLRAGISLDDEQQKSAHVAFACYETPCQEDDWYGASIPLERALSANAEVILALEMNDETLPVAHGYPVRVVTPGIAGARAVKWLDQITVQTQESQNHYQQYDYKVLPPEATDVESAKQFWDKTPAIQEMPVNSVIAVPQNGAKVKRDKDGCIEIGGYALPSGENGPVTRVEVSTNGGVSWTDAELISHPDEGKWSWKLWRAKLNVDSGQSLTILSKATDAAGNTQPEQSEWNLRGVCYNGYGMLEDITVK